MRRIEEAESVCMLFAGSNGEVRGLALSVSREGGTSCGGAKMMTKLEVQVYW